MFAREFDKAVAAGVRNAPIVDIDIILTKYVTYYDQKVVTTIPFTKVLR